MPSPRLTLKDKAKIERLYLKGHKPSEIATEVDATAAQITRYVYRHGLSKQRGEIKERTGAMKTEAVIDVVTRLRQQTIADLEPVIIACAESLKIDADILKDFWAKVENASDASALMRAKKLHQDRCFDFLGLNEEPASAKTSPITIDLLYIPLKEVNPKQVAETTENITPALNYQL